MANIDERVRALELEIELIKLQRRQAGRQAWIIVLCLIAALPTSGIALAALIGLLIWHANQCKKERAAVLACFTEAPDLAAGETPAAAPVGPVPEVPAVEPKPAALRAEPVNVEQVIGRPVFLTLGTLALLFAAASFIALPTEVALLAPGMRLSIIVVAAIVLLVIGDRQFMRVPTFGYALLGGGFGLLIISAYGILVGFEGASYFLVFGLMLIITLAMAFIATRHNSWPLAGLGLLGGLLGPMYIGFSLRFRHAWQSWGAVEAADYAVVAVYLLILLIAALGLYLLRNWFVLPFLALLGAYIVLGELYVDVSDLSKLIATGLVFLVTLAGSLYQGLFRRVATDQAGLLLVVANCALFAIYGVERIYSGQPVIQGAIGVACAILLALLASLLSTAGERKRLMETLSGLAVVYLAIALLFLLERELEAIAVILIAVLTAWMALRFGSSLLRAIAALEMFWALGMVLFLDLLCTRHWWHIVRGADEAAKPLPYANTVFIVDLAVIGGAFLVLWLWWRAGSSLSPAERSFISFGVLLANITLVVLLQTEALVWQHVDWVKEHGWQRAVKHTFSIASYILHGVLLTYLGLRRDSTLLRYSGLALFGWTVLWVVYKLIAHGELGARVIALIILGVALILASSWYYRRYAEVQK